MIGILSDIHGNLPALEAALSMGAAYGVRSWFCLGDIVDGGRGNNECVRLIRDLAIPTVRGNHDEDFTTGIAEDVRAFLLGCALSMERDGCFMTHISPRRRVRKVADRYEAWNVFDDTSHRMMWLGHSHISAIWSERCAAATECRETVIELGRTYHLPDDDRYIISVGSLGYSRDAHAEPRFATWEPEPRKLVVHPVAVAPISTVSDT